MPDSFPGQVASCVPIMDPVTPKRQTDAKSPFKPSDKKVTLEDEFKDSTLYPKSRLREKKKPDEPATHKTPVHTPTRNKFKDFSTNRGVDKALEGKKRVDHSRKNSLQPLPVEQVRSKVANGPAAKVADILKPPPKQRANQLKMPTPQQQNRRVKGKRISRAFLIGSEAWKLDPNNPPPKKKELHTTGWRVYIRPVPGGPDLGTWLKRVVFVLHPTFENSVRSVEGPPFELEETGYGGFSITIKLYFQSYAAEKQQVRQHFLQLEPYGDEALQATQKKDNLVRSEYVEYIEFNEPTEQLFDALTNDNQWEYLAKSRGKGKNRSGLSVSLPSPHERTVELPDNAPEGSVYSKDTEETLLKLFAEAEKKVMVETEEVLKKTKEINEKTQKLVMSNEVNAKLVGVADKLPPPPAAPANKKR